MVPFGGLNVVVTFLSVIETIDQSFAAPWFIKVNKPTDKYNDLHKLVDGFRRWNDSRKETDSRPLPHYLEGRNSILQAD
jgi:hypothetical protein